MTIRSVAEEWNVSPARAAEIVAAGEPSIWRGAAADWPAVAAGLAGPAATSAYLLGFDGGKPLGLLAGAPEIAGRFFYRPDLSDFNFARSQITLPLLLDALYRLVDERTPPSLYAGASTAADHFPGWAEANPLSLVPADAMPRVWIGNASRVSTHFDMASNVAAVAAGRRRFTLFPPEQARNLYVGPLDWTMAGQPTSMVDIESPDLERFPRFAEAMSSRQVAELEPGDAIFIPALWWHEVRAEGPLNVLVNYWWTRGTPSSSFAALVHAIMAIRDRPPEEREALRHWFDHYVFGDDAARAADHLPADKRGILGPFSPARDERIRAYLSRMLG